MDDENMSQKDEYRIEKGGKFMTNKVNMSRTDGGQMGFLSPLKMKNTKMNH